MDDRTWAFDTSGTTGQPVVWHRTPGQIDAEAALLATLCGAQEAGVDGVVSFAPLRHLYGHLMGIAVPTTLKVPCRLVSVAAPLRWAFAGLRRPLVAAMPAAIASLQHSVGLLRGLDEIVLVHGSAVLTPATTTLLGDLDGRARLVDLFGSTETGLVGYRRSPDAPWTPAPDVTLTTEPDSGRLIVHSPRIATEPGGPARISAVLEDVVSFAPDGTFRWLGRSSRMLKINGRRVYLDQVETVLRSRVPGAATRCQPEADPRRGEWFDVYVSGADPAEVADVERACRTLPAWQRPRTVRAA